MSVDLNFDELEKEFNLQKVEKQITEMKNVLSEYEDLEDADDIIKFNIKRANRLLDLAESNMSSDFNSRVLEACSKLIGEITVAANSLMTYEFQNQNIDLKERTLDLREFEVKLKSEQRQELPSGNQQNIQNNIVLTDRESLLQLFNNNSDIMKSIINDDENVPDSED